MPNLINQTLGGYRIIKQIGLGGMGTVFKAYQPAMDRYVALKVISTHLAQASAFVQRFEQEAKVIAKLEHVNILPVYDYGRENDYFYLAMRLIEAGTLQQRLKQQPLTLEEASRVVTQVGSALAYAHQQGVIHRDFKPSNVLMDPQGDCYLTDFGIAKMVEGASDLTGSGIVGTPHYMAPEQGQSQQVDHRADIYAMGVVIYRMVTGRVPFKADTPFAVVLKHIREPLPLPRSINPTLPEAVERVILRALAKKPADRYQKMVDLVTAFERAVQDAPIEAVTTASIPPAPTPASFKKPPAPPPAPPAPKKRRWAAAFGLILVILATAAAAVTFSRMGIDNAPTPSGEDAFATQVAATLYAEQTAQVAAFTPTPTATSTSTPTAKPTQTPTQTPTSLPDAIAKAEVVQMRAGPGGEYDLIGQVQQGEALRVTGRNDEGKWLEVIAPDNTQGWVAAMWLQINTPLDSMEIAAIPATPTPTVTPTPSPTSTPTITPTPSPVPPTSTPTPTPGPENVQVGQIFADPVGDVPAPYIDVVALSSSLQGELLRVTLQFQELPPLLLSPEIVEQGTFEYDWQVDIDADNQLNPQLGTGRDYYFHLHSRESDTSQSFPEWTAEIAELAAEQQEGLAEKNILASHIDVELENIEGPNLDCVYNNYRPASVQGYCNFNVEVDIAANTITFIGIIPGISEEARLNFKTSAPDIGIDTMN